MPKRPDWNSPHIRSINPAARDHVGWYDSTPGFAPSYRGRKIGIGAVVQVKDQGLSSGWRGRIVEHMMWRDGTYTGLSIALCLDTGGILNKVVGRADQIEIVNCTLVDPAD